MWDIGYKPINSATLAFAVSGSVASINLWLDLISFQVTQVLIKLIAESKAWIHALTYWIVDLFIALAISIATYFIISTTERIFYQKAIIFAEGISGSPASIPYALTGFVPTVIHFGFAILTFSMGLWLILRRFFLLVLYRAWEQDASPFGQIAGGLAVIAGVLFGISEAIKTI